MNKIESSIGRRQEHDSLWRRESRELFLIEVFDLGFLLPTDARNSAF